MTEEQPRLVWAIVAMLIAPFAIAAYFDRDGSITRATAEAVKKEAKKVNGCIVDRLADGTGAVFDGRGRVWICVSEDEARKFANAGDKQGFRCVRDN